MAIGSVLAIAAIAAGVFYLSRDDGKADNVAAGSSTTVAGSVRGQKCVAMKGDPPPGAPTVPVKVGAPPKKLVKEDLKEGTGAEVTPGANLKVNYIGVSCSSGKIFDSSYAGGKPAEFPLSQVIKGWQEGIPGMKVGGQRLLGIPPDLAYGSTPGSPDIKPDETLWFVVEVVEATPA